jgi:catechol 2,3-dioxygenase-like lactoylglutathione lyase family enzyme
MEFYTGVLGFDGRRSDGGSGQKMSFLRCGVQGVDLFEVRGDVHGGEEMNHLALCVASEDLAEVVNALGKVGVKISERTRRDSVFVHDPDGHRIEILPISAQERAAERDAARAPA